MHGIRVSWQRRQAAICLFSFVPLSGKKREEFRKGWRNEMTVDPVPKKHHPDGYHAVKYGPRGDLVAGGLTPKVEERNGRGISWRGRQNILGLSQQLHCVVLDKSLSLPPGK